MDSAWLGGASHSVNDVSNIENGYIPGRVINNYYSITFRHCVSRHDVMKYLACHKRFLLSSPQDESNCGYFAVYYAIQIPTLFTVIFSTSTMVHRWYVHVYTQCHACTYVYMHGTFGLRFVSRSMK